MKNKFNKYNQRGDSYRLPMIFLDMIEIKTILSATRLYKPNKVFLRKTSKEVIDLIETKYKGKIKIIRKRENEKRGSNYYYLDLLPLPEESKFKYIQIRVGDHSKNYGKNKSESNEETNDMVFSISPNENSVEKIDKVLQRILKIGDIDVLLITVVKNLNRKEYGYIYDVDIKLTSGGHITGTSDTGVRSAINNALTQPDAMKRLRVDELDFDFIKEVISGLINKKIDLAKANKPDDKEITKYFTFVTNEKPFTYHQIMAWLLSAINQKSII